MTFAVTRALQAATDVSVLIPDGAGEPCDRWTWTTAGHIPERNAFKADGVHGFGPCLNRRALVASSSPSINRVVVPGLDMDDLLKDGFYDGASFRAYRVVGGVLTLVREDTVSRAHMRDRTEIQYQQVIPAATTNWRWSPSVAAPFWRPNAPVWFAVSTVASDGTYSAPSAWVSWTTPATFVSTPVSNATLTNRTLTTETGGLSAPTGVALVSESSGQVAAISWNAVGGAFGYVVWRTQYDPATPLLWDTLDLAGGAGKAAVLANDLIMLDISKPLSASRYDWYTDRYGSTGQAREPSKFGWQADYTGVTFSTVADPVEGERMRIAITAGNTLSKGWVTHSGTGQARPHYFPVFDPAHTYGITIRARGAVGGEVITLRQGGPSGNVDRTVTLTTQWADHTVTFPARPLQTTATLYSHAIIAAGPMTFDISSFVVHRTQPGDVPMRITQEDRDLIAEIAPSFLRMHGWIKSHPWSYNLDGIATPVGMRSNGVHGASLPSSLANCAEVSVNPWIQIEWVWTDAEWLGLIEYLCAPYDPGTDTPASKPWAYRRHAQGRTAPWVDAFSAIWFEHGNENWQDGSVAGFYPLRAFSGVSSGAANGLMLDRIVNVFRSSPYWTPAIETKFKFVLGARIPSNPAGQSYSAESAAASLEADYIMYADYNGGWESGNKVVPVPEEPQAWVNTLGNVVSRNVRELVSLMHDYVAGAPAERTKPLKIGTYEAGPGYLLDGLAGDSVTPEQAEQQEYVMKSVAAGTATLDGFLLAAALGVPSQNFFTYGPGGTWSSHSPWQEGGKLNPQAMLLGFVARELLPGTVQEATPLIAPKGTRGTVTDNLLSVYRINADNGVVGLVLCNRNPSGAYTATIACDMGATATLYTMTGDYQTHNTTLATADAVAITGSVVATSKKFTATVPAGETIIYIWGAA